MDRRKTMSQEEMFTSKIFLVCTVCELSLNSTVKSYSELSITWSVGAGMQRPHKKNLFTNCRSGRLRLLKGFSCSGLALTHMGKDGRDLEP